MTQENGAEPLQEALRLALRDAASSAGRQLPDREIEQAVRFVVRALLADGIDRPGREEVGRRISDALKNQSLEDLSVHFNEAKGPSRLRIAKRGGRKSEPYQRAKLLASVHGAAKPFLPAGDVLAMVEEIENDLGASSSSVPAERLRAMVSERLRRRDERAFLRYALGGDAADETLQAFLRRITPAPQVLKRNGAVVLFESAKLTKSIRRSFVPQRREECTEAVAEFVASEERRVRDKVAIGGDPEPTENIGRRVMDWLFDLDEIAWANYWLAFASDHEELADGSPTQQLAKAHADMRRQRAMLAAQRGEEPRAVVGYQESAALGPVGV